MTAMLGFQWWQLAVLAATAITFLAVGLALGALLGRHSLPQASLPAAGPAPAPTPAPSPARVPFLPPPPPPAADPRLVAGLIGAHDLAEDNEAVRRHVEQVLRTQGIATIIPADGTPFDPELHNAVGTRPTAPGETDGTIAGVTRPGWRSQAGVIRPTEVVVRT